MRILDKYILREIVGYFAISLVAFTGLLLTLQMLRYANLIINKGVEFTQIARVFLAIIPTFLELAIPMAALLGVMLAFARLSGDSEIVVIRASGVGLRNLIKPVFIFATLMGLIGLYVSLELKPWGYRHLSQTLFEIARTKSTAGLNPGVFNNLGTLTLYSEKINDRTGHLQQVLIDDRREEKARKIITAQRGRISSDESEHSIVFELRDGSIHEIVEDKYVLTHFVANNLTMSADELYDPKSKKKSKRSRELSNADLEKEYHRVQEIQKDLVLKASFEEPSEESAKEETPSEEASKAPPGKEKPWTLKRANKSLNSMRIEMGKRLSMPFAAFILALVAMPLGVQPPRAQRTWGAGLSVVIGMTVFVIYYGVLSVSVALAESGGMHPTLSVWLPNILSGAIAYYSLRKMGSEEWQSIAHGFEIIWNRVRLIASKAE